MFSAPFRDRSLGGPGGEAAFLSDTRRIFPNLSVECHEGAVSRSVEGREIGGFPIARVASPHISVHTSRHSAARYGMAERFKFYWQLSGAMRLEDAERSVCLSAGDAILLSLSSTYRLDLGQEACGLILMFSPTPRSSWGEAAYRHHGRKIGMNGASVAASATIAALLAHARGSRTDALAVRSALELAFAALEDEEGIAPASPASSGSLRRAVLLVEEHISDPHYGPEQLAADLGWSRRTLYNRFAELGLTPAGFIRRQRLRSARADILGDPAGEQELGVIALRNGFTDSSSLSHAFKAAYGIPPSRLRLGRKPL